MYAKDYVIPTEIKNYIYCQCCWWDEFEGLVEPTTDEMIEGIKEHDVFARKVIFYQKLLYISLIVIAGSLTLMLILFIASHFLFRIL